MLISPSFPLLPFPVTSFFTFSSVSQINSQTKILTPSLPQTSVGVHQYSSSTYAAYFHLPTSFVPARWLPTPPPEFANDILDSNQPFSTGPRNCLGKNLAYGEMRCILARMVWHFDMCLDEASEGWDRQKSFVLWEKGSLRVRLENRVVG